MIEPSSSTYSDSSGNDDQFNRNEDHDKDLDRDPDPGSEDEDDPLDSGGSNISPRGESNHDERPHNQSGIPGYFSPEPYRWPPLHIYYMCLKADIATLLQRGALHVLSPG